MKSDCKKHPLLRYESSDSSQSSDANWPIHSEDSLEGVIHLPSVHRNYMVSSWLTSYMPTMSTTYTPSLPPINYWVRFMEAAQPTVPPVQPTEGWLGFLHGEFETTSTSPPPPPAQSLASVLSTSEAPPPPPHCTVLYTLGL